ncbi:MAG: arginine repressor [Clostridiales bacterium]|jgi:transcriptional regulator of arginine metabolism|nr:arginine repressor [Clostridiales bacterium]
MARNARHAKLLELIAKKEIETQEELAAQLQQAGFVVTQATVSRDIKDLGLVKVQGATRRQKYAKETVGAGFSNRFIDLFRHSVLSVEYAQNIVVVKTLAGSANVAGLMIDSLKNRAVLGCVAGDDTVFAVLSDESAAEELTHRLKEAAYL